MIGYLTEELPSKVGLLSPGMHIPVISIKEARTKMPDVFLLLAWNYLESILEKESNFIKKGGKFILPVEGVKLI